MQLTEGPTWKRSPTRVLVILLVALWATGLTLPEARLALLAQEAPAQPATTEEAGAAANEPPQNGDPAIEAPDRVRQLIRAGATWADLRGELVFPDTGVVSFEGDFGFAVGVGLEIRLGGDMALQPEVQIVRRFSQVGVATPDGRSSKLSTHYLEVPLYLKWYPGGRDGSRGNLVIGPVPGLVLGATREIRDGNQIQDVPTRGLLADLDWAVGIGGGFEFSEAFANFTVDVRYVHGFTDMNAPETATTARWSTVQVLAGIAF